MSTKIAWTEKTWNPITGCTKIAAGCQNCYAETMTKRLRAMRQPKYADGFNTVVCHPSELKTPLGWKKPSLVFVNSMSDLFHDDVPSDFINKVFATMASCPQHTFQVLTKRPERMREAVASIYGGPKHHNAWPSDWWHTREGVLPNVWLGTSVSTQEDADRNIQHLLKTPAAVRFLSVEPLLEEIDFKATWSNELMFCRKCEHTAGLDEPHVYDTDTPDDPDEAWPVCPACGCSNLGGFPSYAEMSVVLFDERPFPPIDWVIVGAESGPKARPCNIEWIRSLRDQCRDAELPEVPEVPLFIKQIHVDGKRVTDIEQFPEDLRIQEYPG